MGRIFVYGASGHAKVVVDVIEAAGRYQIFAIVDDAPNLKGTLFCGYPVIGGKEELARMAKEKGITSGMIAVGDCETRSMIATWCEEQQINLVKAVHPSAVIAKSANIGAGTVVMAGAVVNPYSRIGGNTVINSRCTIDHDCLIGDSVHLSPGSVLCGNVQIGDLTFVGAGSIIVQNIRIGRNALVGAGSTVLKNVPENARVVGTPAEPMSH